MLRLLDDRTFRQVAAGRVANAQVRDFWLREYESYPRNFRAEAIAPIQNKVGAFLANPVLHNIVTQPKSSFDLRRVMDECKILLVNLAKGKIGEFRRLTLVHWLPCEVPARPARTIDSRRPHMIPVIPVIFRTRRAP